MEFTKFYDSSNYSWHDLAVEDTLYYISGSTIHVRRYNKVDAPEQRKGLVWEGKAVARVEMGFGTRERWPMPFYAYRMHTHPF